MLEILLSAFNFNLTYANKLVADVPDEQMCVQPVPGRTINHPAFVLGHLAWVADNMVGLVGFGTPTLGAWKEHMGMGAKPVEDRSKYPSKAELLKALENGHARLTEVVAKITPDALAQPAPERMRGRFPTIGNMLAGLMTSHEAVHLGQLSTWRRVMGLPSVF